MTVALTLDHISHSIVDAGEAKPTLAPLTRVFEPGRLSVVGGPSGAGKTTLLSILSLTVRAAMGMIRFGDENLSALSPSKASDWRRRHIGMVFQTSRLFSLMTAAEHVTLAARIRNHPLAEAQGLTLLRDFGLEDKLSHTPDTLSGGEKQRVAIAQALCFSPPILLADEPTAALDQSNAELVANTLRAYAREREAVVICVSHDRAVIDAADELLMLAKP